jgi:hypothetical protein
MTTLVGSRRATAARRALTASWAVILSSSYGHPRDVTLELLGDLLLLSALLVGGLVAGPVA